MSSISSAVPIAVATSAADRAAHRLDTPAGQTRLPIEFTGSGGEYFRIWIVNLLLTLVTLGLYHPWAKVRKLRYFHGHTQVGGHALDFHGDPKRMLRGFLLVGALFVLYGIAGNVSPEAGTIALVIVGAVWPALLRASLQFRMANTSWRGLRFAFNGTLGGAYKALLPAYAMGIVFIVFGAVVGAVEPAAAPEGRPERLPDWFVPAIAAVWLGVLAALPLLWWTMKRYQHDHYAYAGVQTQLRTGPGSFYGVFLSTVLVSVLALVAVFAVVLGVAFVFGLADGVDALFSRGARPTPRLLILGTTLAILLGYAVFIVLTQSYFAQRMQNLVWNRTKSTQVRFESALKTRSLVGLTLKNWLLVLLTLGLYWPFAAIAMARLKLEAVTVYTRHSPDLLIGRAGGGHRDATGDAAADLFGIDVGL